MFPSHGKFVGASSEPLNAGQKASPTKFVGTHWRMTLSNEFKVRYFLYDTNFWKTYGHERLSTGMYQEGSVSLPKPPSKHYHDQFISNLRSEYPVTVEGRGRTVKEWKLKPGEDNHFFDCFVGCYVAASSLGCHGANEQTKFINRTNPNGKKRRRGGWRKFD